MTVQNEMNAAFAAYNRGDMKAARAHGAAAMRVQPKNPTILQFMGVAHCTAGDQQGGADCFRRAIAHGGDTEDNRINLAKALSELGQFEEALSVCNKAEPVTPALQQMAADIMKRSGRVTEAVWSYERLAHESPGSFDVWNNLGNARHELGDFEGALEAFRTAQQIDPQSSLIHTNIARVMLSKDQHEDACFVLEKAVNLAPNDPRPLLELGRALTNVDQSQAALRALGDAARLDPRDPKIFVAIGLAFNDLSEPPQAERAFKFAIQADGKHSAAYLNLGIIFEKANRIAELEALIEAAGRAGVTGDEIAYLQALLASRQGDAETALAIAQSIQSTAIHPTTRAQFIGQLADRLGQIDIAYRAFEDMNLAMAQTPLGMSTDRTAYQRNIDGLSAQTTAAWYDSWPKASVEPERPSPAFLVGFPRSGTTLLDTILMGHSAAHVLEEIPLIETVSQEVGDFDQIGTMDAQDIAAMRALYFAELDRLSPPPPGKLVIDKNPLSMIRMPLIHRLFPDAKIILAMRHPCDVVLSCYMQNFKPTTAMAGFLDLTNAARNYDRIFAYWETCMAVLPLTPHMLRYEAMVADVGGTVRPLFDFLGLEWEDQVLDHQKTASARGYIRTPSYAQVTEPVYATASGRWTRYRPWFNEVLPILEPWITRYGYSSD